jgi:hypothetical protein
MFKNSNSTSKESSAPLTSKPYTEAMLVSKSYILGFWVGLMDGDGSIQVNHWQKRCLQYRVVIKLRNHEENVKMLQQISAVVGGHTRIQKNFVLWVENTRARIVEILKIFQNYPPLTTRLRCQIHFALLCLQKNDVEWYLENRKSKYSNRAIFTDLCQSNAKKLLCKANQVSSETYKSQHNPTQLVSEKRSETESKKLLLNCEIANAWFAGFVEAEGCFNLHKRRNAKSGKLSISGRFILGQKFDLYLLESILSFLSANSRVLLRKSENDFYFIQIHRKDVLSRIQKQLCFAPLLGYKKVQYEEFLNILVQYESESTQKDK